MIFYTIGAYNSNAEAFFEKLISSDIDFFCDIRQKRGMRGSSYKFANSIILQQRLNELNIAYLYVKQLAPTMEIRKIQREADYAASESKYGRNALGKLFVEQYRQIIIQKFDFDGFLGELDLCDAHRVVLFCVEENPGACHRSIVSEELVRKGFEVRDL